MAEADWTYLNDGLDIATVDRGVTAGIARPPGGGRFLFAFNSLASVEGAVAIFANLVDFAPMAKGASIRGCIQRGPSGGPTGFSPFFFLSCQGNSVEWCLPAFPTPRDPGRSWHRGRASPKAPGCTCGST